MVFFWKWGAAGRLKKALAKRVDNCGQIIGLALQSLLE
jgi:hypothetical protein